MLSWLIVLFTLKLLAPQRQLVLDIFSWAFEECRWTWCIAMIHLPCFTCLRLVEAVGRCSDKWTKRFAGSFIAYHCLSSIVPSHLALQRGVLASGTRYHRQLWSRFSTPLPKAIWWKVELKHSPGLRLLGPSMSTFIPGDFLSLGLRSVYIYLWSLLNPLITSLGTNQR